MVIEHVVVVRAEHGDDGEHPLSRARDELLHGGASLQLDEVEAAAGRRAQPDLTVACAGAVPAGNMPGKRLGLNLRSI